MSQIRIPADVTQAMAEQIAMRAVGRILLEHHAPLPVREDPTIGNEEILRGIPVVGGVSGTIRGTRPGDTASGLDD